MPAHYRIVRTSVDRVPYKVAFQVRILRGGKATKHFRIVHLSAAGAFFDSPEKGLIKGHCGLNRARTSRGQYAFLLLKMRNTVIVMI